MATAIAAPLPNVKHRPYVLQPSYPYCQPYHEREEFETHHQTNTTYGTGIGLSMIGLNVSAQTGYGASVQVSFHVNATGSWFCGNNGVGFQASSSFEAYQHLPS